MTTKKEPNQKERDILWTRKGFVSLILILNFLAPRTTLLYCLYMYNDDNTNDIQIIGNKLYGWMIFLGNNLINGKNFPCAFKES